MKTVFSFLVFATLALNIACTRENNKATTLKFNLSDFAKKGQTLSTQPIKFIAINVTGPSMPRILCKFDVDNRTNIGVWKGNCGGDPLNPLEVVVNNVPTGNSRLIQILAIIQSVDTAGNENEDFSYGEVKQDVVPGDNLISLTTKKAPQSTNKDGTAVGRYLMPDGTAYTGKIAMEYTPPTGSPNMEIMDLEMFNGWFHVYLLDNIKMTYRMRGNGHVLFGSSIGQTSAIFNAGTRVKKMTLPVTYNMYDNRAEKSEFLTFGFWKGTAVDTVGQICHDSTAYTSGDKFLDNSFTNALDWPADYAVTGGSTCAISSPLVTASKMSLDGQVLEHGGGSRIFRGPYMKQSVNGKYEYLNVSHDGTKLNVGWKYLPGVTTKGVAGSSVFYTATTPPGYEDSHDGGDGLDCSKLINDGFSKFDVTGSAETASFNAPQDVLNTGKVIVCPRKSDGTYYSTVVETYGGGNNCTNCGGPQATKLHFSTIGNAWTVINRDSCVPLFIQAQDNTGNPAYVNSMSQINLNSGTVTGSFYDEGDSYCNTPTSSIYLDPGKNQKIIYFKASNSGDSGTFTASDNNGVLSSSSFSITNVTLNTTANFGAGTGAAIISSYDFYRFNCEPVFVFALDIAGNPVAPSSATIVLDDNGLAGDFFFNYNDCVSNSSQYNSYINLSISGGIQTMAVAYYKNTSGTGNVPFNLRLSDDGITTIYQSVGKNLKDPGAPTRTFTTVNPINTSDGMLRTGFCYPLQVNLEDNMGYKAPATAGFNVTVSVNPAEAELHVDSACSGGGPTQSLSFTNGTASNVGSIYVLPLATNVNFNVSPDNGMPSENFGIMADQTQAVFMGPFTLAANSCEMITLFLTDSYSSPLNTGHVTNKVNYNNTLVSLNAPTSSPYLSDTPSSCANNYGLNSPAWGYFFGSEMETFYLKTDTSGSVDIMINSPGIMFLPANFTWP